MDDKLTSTRKNCLRILCVPNELLLDILFAFSKDIPQCIQCPVMRELPEDVEVIGTWYSPERDTVCFKLRHESFGELAEGYVIPEIRVSEVLLKKVETKAMELTIADEQVRLCEHWATVGKGMT
jgi:hypothetical protein